MNENEQAVAGMISDMVQEAKELRARGEALVELEGAELVKAAAEVGRWLLERADALERGAQELGRLLEPGDPAWADRQVQELERALAQELGGGAPAQVAAEAKPEPDSGDGSAGPVS